jgi:predicted O-linked N-acetylglucosamine transferase (SPINDLY family)
MKPGRNDPCPCGSGKKFKHCCERKAVARLVPPPSIAELNQLIAMFNAGQLDEVVQQSRLLTQQFPQLVPAWKVLGASLHRQGKEQEALPALLMSTRLSPADAEAHYNLAVTQGSLKQLHEAVASYRKALILKPDMTQALNNLGEVLQGLGQIEAAANHFRKAISLKPDYAAAHSNLLFCLNHSIPMDAQALFAEHCRFAEHFEAPLQAERIPHSNTRDANRCLQVGLVSADLHDHAVASFIEPVLTYLAQSPQLSLHAYYNNTIEDNGSRRLRNYFKHWHPIVGLTDAALAQKVRADGIDILYDLSGHTGRNRLLAFARKPAPIQIAWCGYPCTTGLAAMDYFQSDRFLFPEGRFEDQFTEKIVCLPASSVFSPNNNAPPVNELPALRNGYLTFGSFNRLGKISRAVVALWSQLLRALPDAKMLLGAMPQGGQYQELAAWFAQEGIAQERLIFYTRADIRRYLELHHQVDICLDTFPYNGGTTTFHALWMGVPTLTLGGNTMAGWAGVSILGHVGLESFAAYDADHFVQRGLYWHDHLVELSGIRTELRERFAQSARGRPDIVAAAMERALRIMWQRWCEGLPAQGFDIALAADGSLMQHDRFKAMHS